VSLYARLAALVLVITVITAGCWKVIHDADRRGYQRAQAEYAAALQEQKDRNHDLQRQAEKRYSVQSETRDRFITQTIREVRHASESLAACPVPPDLRRLLHGAAACARGDSAAACGPGDEVPGAR